LIYQIQIINFKLYDRVLVYISVILEYLKITILSTNKKKKIIKLENIERGIEKRKELYHIKTKIERSPRINLIKYVVKTIRKQ
jgi:hypothetical protein